MAAYQALQPRIAAAGATCIYLSKPPGWFAKVVKAAMAAPVVVNVKGMAPDDTPVIITLAQLEALQAAAAQVAALAVLMPDRMGIAADGAGGDAAHAAA